MWNYFLDRYKYVIFEWIMTLRSIQFQIWWPAVGEFTEPTVKPFHFCKYWIKLSVKFLTFTWILLLVAVNGCSHSKTTIFMIFVQFCLSVMVVHVFFFSNAVQLKKKSQKIRNWTIFSLFSWRSEAQLWYNSFNTQRGINFTLWDGDGE